MAKNKYRYNPETLQYENVETGFKRLLLKATPYILGTIGFSILFLFLFMRFFDTPEERSLKNENEFLAGNLSKINQQLETFDAEMNKLAKEDNQLYRVIYQMDSIPQQIRNSGFGGTNRYENLKGHHSSNLVIDISQRLDVLNKKMNVQKSSYSELSEILKSDEIRLTELPIIQPIHNKDLTRLGSHFGMRYHPILHIYRMHDGIDLTAPKGSPVYASGAGTVIRVDHNRTRRGYGNLVIIDHGTDGLTSRYAHLSTIKVKKGQKVKRGEQIGEVGTTGMSTGPHLHYEIRKNGVAVNPLYYILDITPDQFDELINLAQLPGKSFD
jgi:murein DD-endopeptidase MepM/ murein hydrolase activator NlpD